MKVNYFRLSAIIHQPTKTVLYACHLMTLWCTLAWFPSKCRPIWTTFTENLQKKMQINVFLSTAVSCTSWFICLVCFFCILSHFAFITETTFNFFDVSMRKLKICIKTNGWKHTYCLFGTLMLSWFLFHTNDVYILQICFASDVLRET